MNEIDMVRSTRAVYIIEDVHVHVSRTTCIDQRDSQDRCCLTLTLATTSDQNPIRMCTCTCAHETSCLYITSIELFMSYIDRNTHECMIRYMYM